jgi:tetratricopeptide (TPR) repeat protein
MWGRVSADRGGFAAGRDINVQGIPPEQWPALLKAAVEPAVKAATDPLERLNAAQRDTIAELERQLASTQEEIFGFFRIIGEARIPAEAIPGKLVEIAEHYQSLVKQAAASPSEDDSETARLKLELRAALKRVDLDRADGLLAQILHGQDRHIESRALEAAATCGQRGDLAMARLRYGEAAAHFGAAASRVPVSREKERFEYLHDQVTALYHEGKEFGENSALRSAAQICCDFLSLCPREPPLAWMLQNNLGTVLEALGERGDGEALQRSIAAYEAALEVSTRERAPLACAMTQHNLGNVLRVLGERGDEGTLWRAVAACEAALEEHTRERMPFDWALTQRNLGNALLVLGERGDDEALQRSIAAYRAALESLIRERNPLEWAMAQHNLGKALLILGQRGDDEALRQAVTACKAALEERTRERDPHARAKTQRNLTRARALLNAPSRPWKFAFWSAIQRRIAGTRQRSP